MYVQSANIIVEDGNILVCHRNLAFEGNFNDTKTLVFTFVIFIYWGSLINLVTSKTCAGVRNVFFFSFWVETKTDAHDVRFRRWEARMSVCDLAAICVVPEHQRTNSPLFQIISSYSLLTFGYFALFKGKEMQSLLFFTTPNSRQISWVLTSFIQRR